MQSGKSSITQLFGAPVQYVIPVFQRGYVWTLTKQVGPLWADIEDRAKKLREHDAQAAQVGQQPLRPVQKHFLGSVVLTPVPGAFGRVPSFEVIDGQQRTTTLLLLLLAFWHAARQLPESPVADMLKSVLHNQGTFAQDSDGFKVWPTQAGRAEMRALLQAADIASIQGAYPARDGRKRLERPLMVQSFLYLHHACLAWLRGVELSDALAAQDERSLSDALIYAVAHDNDVAAIESELPLLPQRAQSLFMALQSLVQLMTLTLDAAEDDPQVIFETLNARGEPLLASDLVRNFVFLEAARRGLDVPALYQRHWKGFDEQADAKGAATANLYWREQERQGRLTHPRIDLFFYHYTVLRRGEETKVAHVFQSFKDWWRSAPERDIGAELARLVQSSEHFRDLVSPDGSDDVAEFGRLMRALDVFSFAPAYLALRERLPNGSPELKQALGDLASYLVRRAVCGLTTKAYNRLALRLMTEIQAAELPAAALRRYLRGLDGDTQVWPDDRRFGAQWLARPVYLELKPARVSALLRLLERASRTTYQAGIGVPLASTLSVEHVLPQNWEGSGYYPLPTHAPVPMEGGAPRELTTDEVQQARARRERLLHTFGNLTLLTQPMNSALSNGPYADQYDQNGTRTAEGKRSGLRDGLLSLNSWFQRPEITEWNDARIEERGAQLLEQAVACWPDPPAEPAQISGQQVAAGVQENPTP